MLLKSLKLKNFRQFKGEHKIVFSTDNQNNVTVVLGKNTSGKTTLIQAFYWILYGKTNFKTSELLNLDIANEMLPGGGDIVIGELKLVHEDIEYKITRKLDYTCTSTDKLRVNNKNLSVRYKLPNGQSKFFKEDYKKKNTINKILPENLSDYFFFDGERIGNLAQNNRHGKKDIAEAVKNVLGLNTLNEAIEHLSKGRKTAVINKFKKSIDDRGDQKLKNKKEKHEEFQEEYNQNISRINDYNESIEYYEDEIKKNEKIIKEHKETSDLKKEMKSKEAEIRRLKENEENELKRLVRYFSKNSPKFFMQPLLSEAIDMLDKYGVADEGIPEMHSKSIDFLIERGECICGRKVENENEAYKNLIRQKNYLPPQSIGTLINSFMKDARHYKDIADDFFESFKTSYKKIREYKNSISELKSRNDDISKEIDGKPDIGKYEVEVRKLKKKLRKLRTGKEAKIKKQGRLENRIDSLEKEIENLASSSKKNKFILDCIEYTKYIIDTLKKHYSAKEKLTKRKLEERVNEIFAKMYHGERKIEIDDDYGYDLIILDDHLGRADQSTGLETITSFSFISGIVSLAKEKAEETLDEDSSEAYPLVMDAPFSNADEDHVENVSKILPKVAEQVIMFIMHKDWRHAEDVLGDRLERIYELDKKTETYTVIKEDKNV